MKFTEEQIQILETFVDDYIHMEDIEELQIKYDVTRTAVVRMMYGIRHVLKLKIRRKIRNRGEASKKGWAAWRKKLDIRSKAEQELYKIARAKGCSREETLEIIKKERTKNASNRSNRHVP